MASPERELCWAGVLLTVVLRPDTSAVGRLIAALFGLGAAVGVLVAYVKHRYTEEVYAEWINSTQQRAGRSKVIPCGSATGFGHS